LSQNLHVEKATGATTGLVRIKADGNVGIGLTLPTTPLHVVGVISGSSFTGAGTGLTGTAASLTAGTANSVAWTNVSGRPTAVSSFTNDSGYLTSVGTIATASYANATATIPFNIGGTSTYYGTVNSSNVGSNNVFTLSTGSYTAGFFKYTVYNGSNARSGEVMAVWNQDTATFTDISTLDLSNTAAVTASVSIVSSQVQLNFQTSTSGWTIKSQGTLI